MSDKVDKAPPTLEDPKTVDYDCAICDNKYIPHSDGDGTEYVCEICEKHLCQACLERIQLRSYYYRKNEHDVDVISDSSRSSDTEWDFVQNLDESNLLGKQLAMRLELFKSMTFEKRVDRDTDTECDYSDMPPLEKAKKPNFDTDEDSDEVPPKKVLLSKI